MAKRMSGVARRAQILDIAAREFAERGLHGASIENIARDAEITQAYVFRIFGTKKALFIQLVHNSFDRLSDALQSAGEGRSGLEALSSMGAQYYDLLDDQTALLLQLQGFAACADVEVRDAVRACFARLWDTAQSGTGSDPVTIKTFLAYGSLLNTAAALDVENVDAPWADGVATRIQPGLFAHITTATNH